MELTKQEIELLDTHAYDILAEAIDLIARRFEEHEFSDAAKFLTACVIGEAIRDALDETEEMSAPGPVALSVAQGVLMRTNDEHRRFMRKSIDDFEGNYAESMRKLLGADRN